MPVNEFVIPPAKRRNVQAKLKHIKELFVRDDVVFTTTDRSSAIQWIRITGEETDLTKEYIKSLCNCKAELEEVIVISPEYYIELTRNNGKHHKELERETLAVIEIINKTELFVQGTDLSFIKAKSFIDERSKQATIQTRPDMRIANSISNSRCSSTISSVSDGHNSDIISRGNGPTLTARPGIVHSNLRDYAHKLGYNDHQIDAAALKLGNKVNGNSLLHELVSVGPKRNDDDDDFISKGAHPGPGRIFDNKPGNDIHSRVSHEQPPIRMAMGDRRIIDNVNHDIIPRGSHMPNCSSDLRHIVVDGSNVAMSHGNREVFSCIGIQICVDYFRNMGHKEITVFVPQWRKETSKPETPITNQLILNQLEKEKILVFTPSRRVNGRRVVCYDDRYIVRLASEEDGIIVSNDHFRDLEKENPEWKQVIDQRLLMYTFVNDRFMPPDDPLGRHGPTLREFLTRGTPLHPKHCPYGRKCTYGQKCRFYHPERQEDTQKNMNKMEYPCVLQNTRIPPNTTTMSASNRPNIHSNTYCQPQNIHSNTYYQPQSTLPRGNILPGNSFNNVYNNGDSLNQQKQHSTVYGYPAAQSPHHPRNVQRVYPNGYPNTQLHHQPHLPPSTGPGIPTPTGRQPVNETYQGMATPSAQNNFRATLEGIFGNSPEVRDKIQKFLRDNPRETNIESLVDKYCKS